MFGFGANPPSVDWSYFGGAEELPPSQRLTTRDSTIVSSTSSGASSSSGSSTPTRRSAASTSATSSDDEVGTVLGSDSKRARTQAAGEKWMPKVSQLPQDPNDFLWLLTEEPHRTRRQAIIKAHPEVTKLMGQEPLTKWISLAVVLLQLGIACTLAQRGWHPLSWPFLLVAYAIGGTANQNTFLAIHEITHNLAFKGIKANKLWAIFVNLPIGVPYAMMFKVSANVASDSGSEGTKGRIDLA